MLYDDLIEGERRKAAWLRERLSEIERRIETLVRMKDDPVARLMEAAGTTVVPDRSASEGAKTAVHEAPAGALTPAPVTSARLRRNRLPEKWVRIFTFIGRDGKAFADIGAFITEAGLGMSHGSVRTGLMNYRRGYGFIENPRPGFYRVTDAAMAAIATQKGESPATPHGEAFSSQPSPVQGPPQPSADDDGQ